MGANDPQDMANLDIRGMVCKIYAGDRYTLIYTKCKAVGLMVLEGFFYLLSIKVMAPRVWPVWTPGAWLAEFM